MFLTKLKNYNIILASKSPRRQQLLRELGVDFEVRTKDGIEELFPEGLECEEIPVYLAELKAAAFWNDLAENELLITSDTIVWLNNMVLNKPSDHAEAFEMLRALSGEKHQVITGVCLMSKTKTRSFSALTHVYFKELSDAEINYYINHYKPFDKAGAYGIQEWIGFIGIERIEGSYFNVMGLPVQKLYEELLLF